MTANVLATAIGGLLTAAFVSVAGAVWKFARSVSKNTAATAENTKQIAHLTAAVEVQHVRVVRRIKRLERRKTREHAELAKRIAKLEGRGDAR